MPLINGTAIVLGAIAAWAAGMAAWATATPGNPLAGIVAVWLVVAAMLAICALYFWRRWTWVRQIHLDVLGLHVGWTDPRWSVEKLAVQTELTRAVMLTSVRYSDPMRALSGCVVLFREPAWTPPPSVNLPAGFRLVTGLQWDQVLEVGWRQNLAESALAHELGHRVVQVCGNDPPGADAILAELGL